MSLTKRGLSPGPGVTTARWAACCAALLLTAGWASAEVIFDGAGLPEDQGWTVGSSNLIPPYPFSSDGTVYDMNTIGAAYTGGPESGPMHLWQRDIGISVPDGFSIELRLQVLDDSIGHNQYDAGIAFLADYHGGFGTSSDRAQMIYFDEDEVGWGDESDTYAVDTTDGFHTYRLDVDATGFAQFYVDDLLALTRSGFSADGVVAFGDQTNDWYLGPYVDGHFQLAWIKRLGEEPEMQPKWIQPPHPGGEGFDEASDFWWNEGGGGEEIKWDQPLDPEFLSALHAHDWVGGWVTLADDWLCQGGEVIGFEWWGDYEDPGAGIAYFHLSIHECQPADPWHLPMDPPLWEMDVPFAEVIETDTGLGGIFGPIYHYAYKLPDPFPQMEGKWYWLDITAKSVDPGQPAVWRWCEARRGPAPPLGHAPAAYSDSGGPWQTLSWYDPPEYSDMAFRVISLDGGGGGDIKWDQPPDPEFLGGLHCHDWMDVDGNYHWITLADDWRCEGGEVVALEWWGDYEDPGSGIAFFHLSIHESIDEVPWPLPMEPPIWEMDVPFVEVVQTDSGLVGPAGPIYHYVYTLPDPFPQMEGMWYWLDISARSVDPMQPAIWRWTEARRGPAPPLGQAPAAESLDGGPWQSIIWAADPEKYSDMAFRVISEGGEPPQEVNKVVADDFISDGRPITAVRWWGSYFDEQYSPKFEPIEPFVLDGWFLSFHHADPVENPGCPPMTPFDDPTVLGVYFAPAWAVEVFQLDMQDCLGHAVYEYVVDLKNCCLLCSEMDPRTGEWPAEPEAFFETAELHYWLDIQAVVGVTWDPPACDYEARILTGHLPSPLTPEGHFWGWHTSPADFMKNGPLLGACTGRIDGPGLYAPDQCWDYTGWDKVWWKCPDVPEPPQVDMAFELLAPPWPVIAEVASCRDHGPSGGPYSEYCLALGLGDQAFAETWDSHGDNVEPRLGGISRLMLDMTQTMNPATVVGGNVQVTCLSGYAGTVTASLSGTSTVVVDFSPSLPDQDCCEIGLAGMASAAGDPVPDKWYVAGLEGDVLQDGLVNTLDYSAIKPRFGQSAVAANARYDLFTDGIINSVDASAVKPRFAHTLPGDCPDVP